MKNNKSFFRKTLRFIIIILGLFFVAFFAIFLHKYRQIKSGEVVKFQGHWYTQEQLHQLIPPQYAPLKEPKNTTEEVYTKFREALLAGRIEEALGYIRERDREYYVEAFNDPERLKAYLGIPEFDELDQDDEIKSFQKGYRYYEKGEETPYTIGFKLNQITALWEIDSI